MPASLTGLEIASGAVCGGTTCRIDEASSVSPIVALERALLAPLQRAPCLVSFSGGKDSSMLLATALHLARREGLPLPVPVTWRFRGAPRADESAWQEEVARALGVTDWQIMTADDELDIVGPVAQTMLRASGVRYPANLQLHQPIVEAAAGGSVVTGLGGDQVLTCWHRPGRSLSQRVSSTQRRLPATLIGGLRSWRARADRPWLRPGPARLVFGRQRRDLAGQPREPIARLAWRCGRRHLGLTLESCGDLASGYDVAIHHPLLDKGFHAALGTFVPAGVSLGRSELIAQIGDGRIPPVAYQRTDKAWFSEVFVGEPARVFASGWQGDGVDEDLVDAQALRGLWSSGPLPAGTDLLIQQLWLQQDQARRRIAA